MKQNITELDLPIDVKQNLERAGIKTVQELGEVPIDIVYEMCNKEMSVVIGLFEEAGHCWNKLYLFLTTICHNNNGT